MEPQEHHRRDLGPSPNPQLPVPQSLPSAPSTSPVDPLPLADLKPPARTALETNTEPQSEETVIRENPFSRYLIKPFIKAISSPAVIAGTGSTIAVLPESKVSAITMGFFTILSAVNEIRGGSVIQIRNDKDLSGINGFVIDKVSQPGFCVWMQGWTYLGTAAKAVLSKDYLKATAFTLFAIGEAACCRIANFSREEINRIPLRVENKISRIWNKFPHNLRSVLKDPGAMFPTGNLILIAVTHWDKIKHLSMPSEYGDRALLGLFGLGAGIALSAAFRGLSPLWTSKETKPSGDAAAQGGTGDILMGTSSTLMSIASNDFAGICVGIATKIWGISNIRLGCLIEPGLIKKHQRKLKELLFPSK